MSHDDIGGSGTSEWILPEEVTSEAAIVIETLLRLRTDGQLALYRDVIAEKLATRYSLKELVNNFAGPVSATLAGMSWETLPQRLQDKRQPASLDAAEAAAYLARLIKCWDESCRKIGHLSRAKWLYVIRRIPNELIELVSVIEGIPREEAGRARSGIRRLLEAQTGYAPVVGQKPMTINGITGYDLTDTEVRDVFQRLFMVEHLWRIQGTARLIGKGARLKIAHGEFPDAEFDSELMAAAAIYDNRMRFASATHTVGTVPWKDADRPGPTTICLSIDATDPEMVVDKLPTNALIIRGTPNQDRRMTIALTYPLEYVDLQPFTQLSSVTDTGGVPWYDIELPALLVLLHSISRVIPTNERLERGLATFGYFRMTHAELYGILAQWRSESSELLRALIPSYDSRKNYPDGIIAAFKKMNGQVDPIVDGPVLRKDPVGEWLVDVSAASRRLLWQLTVGRYDGATPNARARHFELAVQATIDETGYGPDASWRYLVGRELRRSDGTAITDIDAVAVLGDTLILIDAKSYPYSVAYGAGRYREVKNLTDKLTTDLAKWDQRIGELRVSPIGRNYDLTAAGNLVGLVVTPFPCYLPRALADMEALPGLRSASSLDELRTYLERRGAQRDGTAR